MLQSNKRRRVCFYFTFSHNLDMEAALKGGPWTFDIHLLTQNSHITTNSTDIQVPYFLKSLNPPNQNQNLSSTITTPTPSSLNPKPFKFKTKNVPSKSTQLSQRHTNINHNIISYAQQSMNHIPLSTINLPSPQPSTLEHHKGDDQVEKKRRRDITKEKEEENDTTNQHFLTACPGSQDL